MRPRPQWGVATDGLLDNKVNFSYQYQFTKEKQSARPFQLGRSDIHMSVAS
jgi:hypothetical protein